MSFAGRSVIDGMIVGNLVASELAGVGIGYTIMVLSRAVGTLMAAGAGAVVALRLGEGKTEEARNIVGQSLWFTTILSIVIAIFGLLNNESLMLFLERPAMLSHLLYCRSCLASLLVSMNDQLATGFSSFSVQLTMFIAIVIDNILLSDYGGELHVFAFTIQNGYIINYLVLMALGAVTGVQPIISYNYGAKLYGRVREATWVAIQICKILAFGQ
ncbi:MATE family efflux transporter [Brevibacillus ginsengisoli]|uniref:MATE family efflux transporter n=1 Tax=Brevibacillus ginsengisoli TaxID=363854 RepID=UPI003CE87FAE